MDSSIEQNKEANESFSFTSSLLSTPIQVPVVESSMHNKNPFHHQSINQSSKTIFDLSHYSTFNKSQPIFDEVSGLQKYQESSNLFSKGQLMEIFGTDNILEEGQFIKMIREFYAQKQIVFIAVTGSSNSGKSLFCDTVLNLGGVKGNHYFRPEKFGNYLWSVPFCKKDLCIFMVEINFDSFEAQEEYIEAVKKLRKIVKTWIVLDIKGLLQLDSVINYICKREEDGCHFADFCVKQVYLLTREHYNNQQLDTLPAPKIFKLPNANTDKGRNAESSLHQLPALIYNPQYLNQVEKIFTKIFNQSQEHYICNKVPLTGQLLVKLYKPLDEEDNKLIHEFLNEKIEKKYERYYKKALKGYEDQIAQFFVQSDPPKESSELYQKLRQISERTFIRYGESDINFMDMTTRQKYYEKLENEIEIIENKVIQKNKEKTQVELQALYEQLKKQNKTEKQIVSILKKEKPSLNHGRESFVKKVLENLLQKNSENNQSLLHPSLPSASVSKLKMAKLQKTYDLNKIQKLQESIKYTEKEIERYSARSKMSEKSHEEGISLLGEEKLKEKERKNLQERLVMLKKQLEELKREQKLENEEIIDAEEEKNKELKNIWRMQREVEEKIENIKREGLSKGKGKKKRNFCGLKF